VILLLLLLYCHVEILHLKCLDVKTLA
jgi:hypothetical protein